MKIVRLIFLITGLIGLIILILSKALIPYNFFSVAALIFYLTSFGLLMYVDWFLKEK